MIKASLASLSDGKKLLYLVFLVLLGAILFSLIGYLVVILAYGTDVLTSIKVLNITSESIISLKILQTLQSLGVFVFPALLAAFLFSRNHWSYLGFTRIGIRSILLVLLIVLASLPGINFLGSINEQIPMADWMTKIEADAESLIKAFLVTDKVSVFLFNIFMVAVIPAIGEELLFRGIIQKHFISITKSQVWGIVITAFLFSLFHFQFKGFIPRFALGVIFGFMYAWSGSIWLSVAAHFTNNAIATIGYTLLGSGTVDPKVEDLGGLSYLWPIGLISIAIVAVLLMKLKEANLKNIELRIQE